VELRLHTLNKPSWRDAQLKKAQGQLYFYLYILRNAAYYLMEYLIECNSNSKYGEITHDRG
jgi:hypothetical protein